MKTLEWNGENSPNRNTCRGCGKYLINAFEPLCLECKRAEYQATILRKPKEASDA
jgi:hypothetical protein